MEILCGIAMVILAFGTLVDKLHKNGQELQYKSKDKKIEVRSTKTNSKKR